MDETSFEELRKVHLEERHSPLLCAIPENFYDAYLSYLDVCSQHLEKDFSIEKARVFENTRRVFIELVRLRCQKVILKTFKDVRTGAITSDDLARQEKDLHRDLLRYFKEYENRFSKFEPVPIKEQSSVKVEILADLPEFVSPGGQTLGPLSKGQLIAVDQETAGLLLAKKICKTV
ncbi:hypothetical protein HY571_01285 [Candidatus Micrarchaeota archaeon]|nr:hypothetical protein [Candidatus Micrarchaeota archaeon]